MWGKWECTDSDCCQYMRQDGKLFEMIEMVWLDVTEEDRENGNLPYIVVREIIDLDDFNEEEIKGYLAPYQYSFEGQDDWTIAECILEEVIMSNWCIVAEFEQFEDAEQYIKEVVNK